MPTTLEPIGCLLNFEPCPWCGQELKTMRVGGHDECARCHQVLEGCCAGSERHGQLN